MNEYKNFLQASETLRAKLREYGKLLIAHDLTIDEYERAGIERDEISLNHEYLNIDSAGFLLHNGTGYVMNILEAVSDNPMQFIERRNDKYKAELAEYEVSKAEREARQAQNDRDLYEKLKKRFENEASK